MRDRVLPPADPSIPEALPLHVCAQRLAIGLTFLNKILRTENIRRWRLGKRTVMVDYRQLLAVVKARPWTPEEAHKLRPRRKRGGAQ